MKTSGSQAQKRILFLLLLCTCLGIWGYVLYQMAGSFQQDEAPSGIPLDAASPALGTLASLAPHRSQVPYDSSFRDPFARPAGLFALKPVVSGKPAEPLLEPKQPVLPPLKLSGIVGETALLQGEAGSVYIMRTGESIEGARILEVRHDHIVVRFQGRSHTLHLAR